MRHPPPAKPSPPAAGAPKAPSRKRRRRGATAMEYLVVASFILVLLIAGVQHLASITHNLMQRDADSTSFMNPSTER